MPVNEVTTLKAQVDKLIQRLDDQQRAIESSNLRVTNAATTDLGSKHTGRTFGVLAESQHAHR